MKKFVAVLSAAAMLATLAACGSTAATTSTAASSADTAASTSSEAAAADDTVKSYKIAVVQQLDHASLDEIRTAVEAELDAKAAEKGITIEYKDFNGQNDATTLNQIGTQVVSDGYNAVVPIATLAAQCMANACAEDQIPVVYAAISDPAAADLTGLDYVTGTSDALNTQFILDMMLAINPDVKVNTYRKFITSENIMDIIKDYDFIIDGTDNFPAKFLINDACVMAQKPFSHAGIIRFKGQLMTYVPGEGPCYRCVFKDPPPKDAVPTCKQAGVIGAMGGVIGSLQAMEAVKYIIGKGDLLTGRLLTYDALTMTFRTIKLPKNHDCPVCGDHPTITKLIDYEQAECDMHM